LVRTSHLWRPICRQEQLPANGEHQIHVLPRSPFSPCCPFSLDADGDFIVEVSIEVRGAEQARGDGGWHGRRGSGPITFAKTGAPQEGKDRSRPLW
jgi:hypothetical protein